LQGAPINSKTQGVALGLFAAALSAPKSKDVQIRIHKSYRWPSMRWLLESIKSAAHFDEVWQWRKQRNTL
jgi:hypothetical protein